MKPLELRGLYPATVTPFASDLSIDIPALRRHLEATAAVPGVQGLVVNGHAGEILSLNSEERAEVVRHAAETKRPGQIVVAGLEAARIPEAIQEGLKAKRAGAEALLVLPPFDVRPWRHLTAYSEPVLEYFRALDREVDLPMIIFEYPVKSGCRYPVEVLLELAELRNVVGIKSAANAVTHHTGVWNALQDKMSVLAACDAPELLGMLLHGAHGSLIGISVVGTEHWVELVDAALNGRIEDAQQVFNRVCIPLMASLFENMEPSGPVQFVACTKEALVELGQIPSARVRWPMVNATDEIRARVRAGLAQAGLRTPVAV